jgi:hypothetical protein
MEVQNVKITDCDGYVQRSLTANGKTFTENIYEDEPSCELVYRKLDADGKETDIERVVALRTHPMEIEFHQRNRKDGFRVNWEVPKTAALNAVKQYVEEAKRLDSMKPTEIGYGITSDPIRECSYDTLFVAVNISIRCPDRAINVDPKCTVVDEFDGYVMRTMKLNLNGETVREKITINEEIGEITYNKCDASGRPSGLERVLAIHTGPLRMEFYQRNARDGMRCAWKAPYSTARETFENIVKIGKDLEKNKSNVIGYGMASKPMTGMTKDTLWKAMLFSVRNPKRCGMAVENVQCIDRAGYMERSMVLTEKPNRDMIKDNVYTKNDALEILYRPVVNNREVEEERVFAIRTDPLRCEMYCRHSRDEMRINWTAPKAVATGVFDEVTQLAQLMYNDPASFEKQFGKGLSAPVASATSYGF